jgi:hypothetical protein
MHQTEYQTVHNTTDIRQHLHLLILKMYRRSFENCNQRYKDKTVGGRFQDQ